MSFLLGFKTSMVVVDIAGLDGRLCCSFVIAGWGPIGVSKMTDNLLQEFQL